MLFSGHSRKHKRLCCLCCKSGPITAVISSNRAGYVPGEMIGFNAEVENLSNRMMEVGFDNVKTQTNHIDIFVQGSFLNLVEIVEYRAAGEIRTEKRVVTKVERGEIPPGNSDYWEGVTMRVPALPPTNLGGNCSIIDVQYRLEFHVDPSGWAFDLVVKIPIIIGKTHLTFSLMRCLCVLQAQFRYSSTCPHLLLRLLCHIPALPRPPPPMTLRLAMTVS